VQVLREKHWKEKKREEMTQRDWRIFREDHRISYKNAGKDAPMPFRNWEEFMLPKKLADAVRDLNYTQPSPIQMASAPFGFRQRDVIGLAETGSGKTAAFVLPMLKYIMEQPPMTDALAAEGPYALILAPTRELAQQIEEETISLAKYTGMHICLLLLLAVSSLSRPITLRVCYMHPHVLAGCCGHTEANMW
jgi:ATP-dependent RNA helicase DDX23/PRP28